MFTGTDGSRYLSVSDPVPSVSAFRLFGILYHYLHLAGIKPFPVRDGDPLMDRGWKDEIAFPHHLCDLIQDAGIKEGGSTVDLFSVCDNEHLDLHFLIHCLP